VAVPTLLTLERAGLVLPDYQGANLAAVMPAAADAMGAEVPGGPEARRTLSLPRAARVCVVLVDGLGRLNLAERSGHAPFLRSLLEGSRPVTAGYPSTTAASLATFGTGTCPGRTGLVGYTVRNPRTRQLANMVSWDGADSPHEWQVEPTVFERVVGGGRRVVSVGPARFGGSGLTNAALRGAVYHGAETLADRVDATLAELVQPGLVYLYWGEVDKIGHHEGWGSWQWGHALEELDRELARLARSLPRDSLLVVTADHGMVDADFTRRWDVATTPGLCEGVELVAGEPRAAGVVAARWQDVLGGAAVVAVGQHAIDENWFGPVADSVRPRIGDVVVAMTGRATVVDSRTQSARSIELVGVHGSMTLYEMSVPLLWVKR
jgi:hypothetical protein